MFGLSRFTIGPVADEWICWKRPLRVNRKEREMCVCVAIKTYLTDVVGWTWTVSFWRSIVDGRWRFYFYCPTRIQRSFDDGHFWCVFFLFVPSGYFVLKKGKHKLVLKNSMKLSKCSLVILSYSSHNLHHSLNQNRCSVSRKDPRQIQNNNIAQIIFCSLQEKISGIT